MKTMLKISMVLNLSLAAGLVFLLVGGHKRVPEAPAAAKEAARVAIDDGAKVTPAPPAQAEPKPFRWSQLEAADYHQYVKNLRAIGCPEFTLRVIVTADVEVLYQGRIAALKGKIRAYEGSSWTNQLAAPGTEEALKAELQKIPGEELAEINDLLGLQPAPVEVAVTPQRRPPAWAGTPPAMPYVLQDIDFSALNLDQEQQQMVAGLRQDFIDRIGGTNQDPNDPAYLARWQKAQAYEDSMLSAYIGGDGMRKIQEMQFSAGGQGTTAR